MRGNGKLKLRENSARNKPWLGKKLSEEHIRKIALANRGNKSRTGQHFTHSEETRNKISLALKGKSNGRGGELHPRWIKDRNLLAKTRNPREDSTESIIWARNVKKRDNWKCKMSNSDCKGRLESHHILSHRDFPELRYEINNGITLCQFHHPRKRVEEKRLIPFFQSMVEVIRT